MGKYIVELKKNETLYKAATRESDGTAYVCSAIGTPYTEPDIEQVRKEAYREGREDGIHDGMCDAWEAARKVADYWMHCRSVELFNTPDIIKIFENKTASEAIEKLKAYEQDAEIKVGDEVIATSGKAVIVGINDDKDKVRYIYPDSTLGFDNICNLTKTGRHFPEIATVLEKMRGEQDG
jgi:hypothetical protein